MMIDRRNFLQLAAAYAGTLFFSKGADEDYAATETLKEIFLCRCPVAGLQYHGGMPQLEGLQAGQPLALRREPENPHDGLAIAVHDPGGTKLGYLPRRLNEIPAGLMDQGRRVVVRVVELDPAAPPWEALVLEVGVG